VDDPARHTNIRYEQELEALRDTLVGMGSCVEHKIQDAVSSFINRNTTQARETIARDVEVNRMDVEIDKRCLRLFALYQPIAADLRLITT
jgi:phosphate transport system protein